MNNSKDTKSPFAGFLSVIAIGGLGFFVLSRFVTIRSFADNQYWYVGSHVCKEALNNAALQINAAHAASEVVAWAAPKQARQMRDKINVKEIVKFNAQVCD